MDEQTTGSTENQGGPIQIDSWEAAFAALDKGDAGDAAGAADTRGAEPDGSDQGAAGDGGQGLPDNAQAGGGAQPEDVAGGYGDNAGAAGEAGGNAFADMLEVTDERIKQYREDIEKSVRDQAIDDIAKEFVKRGIRNRDGVLGASIDDPDICKRDEDGVPHFFNPETGREFMGDNPRRQAQEYCEDYNKELAKAFNKACEQYEKHLMEQEAPRIAVMEFAPKYERLDPIRKGMFDNVIEDYELKDDAGNVYGYSCDLDKALALVERQVAMIQQYAKSQAPKHESPAGQSSGPALDMKTSSGAVYSGSDNPPKSLAEAMERLQDRELEKFKNRKR